MKTMRRSSLEEKDEEKAEERERESGLQEKDLADAKIPKVEMAKL